MKYTDQYIKKLNDFHQSLALIRLRPQDRDAHINLYQQYLRSYPFLEKKLEVGCIFAGSLGPFHFVDTSFDVSRRDHEFTMQYYDEEITISSKNNFHVMHSTYTNNEEKVHLENYYYEAILDYEKNMNNIRELYFPNREN